MSDLLGLSNLYIDDILKQACKEYLGIFSCDNIPPSLKDRQGSIVVNLSPSRSLGTHFITILLLPRKVLYIDSLGEKCETAEILQFLTLTDRPIFYQSEPMQKAQSSYCGFYCMLVVTQYELSGQWTNPFTTKNNDNDVLCIYLLCHNLQKLKK